MVVDFYWVGYFHRFLNSYLKLLLKVRSKRALSMK
ncbi:hypothetical protein NT04LM_3519, partial [Listeria monocytogenes FSL F2-208]